MKENSIEARLLHTLYERPDACNALSMPVYHTAAYCARLRNGCHLQYLNGDRLLRGEYRDFKQTLSATC